MVSPADDEFGVAARLEGVPSALAAARDGIDALLRDRGLRRTTAAVTAESLLRGAVASARLAGSQTSLQLARDGQGDDLARRAIRLYTGLLALAPVVARSPLEALARMHSLVAAGSVEPSELGRPRPDPAAAAMLRGLSRSLLAATSAPAIAVAALAHADLITHAPFGSGNDLLGRALERLLLVSRGVDPASSTVPEAGHLLLRDGYLAALSAYQSRDPGTKREWLLHAAAALGHGVAESPLRDE